LLVDSVESMMIHGLVNPKFCNCNCILVCTSLKMVTQVAERSWRMPSN